MKWVHFHFQKYLHGSREGFIAYVEHEQLMELIEDKFQVFPTSSTRLLCIFWPKKRKRQTHFGNWIQTIERTNLRWSPRLHTNSDLDILLLYGKLMVHKVYIQMDMASCHIILESSRNIDLI